MSAAVAVLWARSLARAPSDIEVYDKFLREFYMPTNVAELNEPSPWKWWAPSFKLFRPDPRGGRFTGSTVRPGKGRRR